MENNIKNHYNSLCTMLVMGCDEYFDVLELNGEFKEKYYPECSFPYFCCTQTRTPKSGRYNKIIQNDSAALWTIRLHNALDAIETPYVMLILDDFFFSQKVDEIRIVEYLNFMERNSAGFLKLIPDGGGAGRKEERLF